MARYIDADKLIEVLKEHRDYYAPNLSKITNEAMSCGLSIAIKETKNTPTADVVEVKHGYWYKIDSGVGWELVGCPICRGEYSLYDDEDGDDYCPYCGAKMDGRSDT